MYDIGIHIRTHARNYFFLFFSLASYNYNNNGVKRLGRKRSGSGIAEIFMQNTRQRRKVIWSRDDATHESSGSLPSTVPCGIFIATATDCQSRLFPFVSGKYCLINEMSVYITHVRRPTPKMKTAFRWKKFVVRGLPATPVNRIYTFELGVFP